MAGTSATTTTPCHDPGEDFHGTHVAGTIAASLNGTGRRRRRARRSRSWPSSSSTTRRRAEPTTWRSPPSTTRPRSACRSSTPRGAGPIRAPCWMPRSPNPGRCWSPPPATAIADGRIDHRQAGRSALLSGQLDARQRPDRRRHRPARPARLVLELRDDLGRSRGAGHEHPFVDPERTRTATRAGRGSPARRWPRRTCPASRRSSSAS